MRNFTIGCDPEFFLKNNKTDKLVSAIPFINGTKYEPEVLENGGNIQRDNVAVEIATDPADTIAKFIDNISRTLKGALTKLPENHEIVALPSARFDADQLEHEEALKFGCDPDYDAWDVKENTPPSSHSDPTFRSCGAHIHVGTTGDDENAFLLEMEGKLMMVKVMDCIHGIISTVLDSSIEALERKKLYGKAGAHRPKEYGVEYRVLSNFWLKSPITAMLMYSLTQDALTVCRDKQADDLIEKMGGTEVVNTINGAKVDIAMKMIKTHLLPILSEDSKFYFEEALSKIKSMDINKEWKLKEMTV